MSQRHIGGIAAVRDENTPDPRGVVARIEGVPAAAEIDFDPCRKIHGRVRRRKADVGNIASAIARRDVQAAAEGNGQMRVVAANAVALYVCCVRSSGGAGVLVAEGHVVVHEIADGLHPRPAERRMSEEAPRLAGKPIGLTVATAKQEQQGLRGQVLDLVLQSVQVDRIDPPGSRTMASVPRLKRPAGATSRLHQFPKLSR